MQYDGLFIATHRDVYEPSDDTFLLARVVKDTVQPGQRFLEVGCGTGVSALTAARLGAHVVATDMNPHAVTLLQHNAKQNGLQVDAREADLMEGVEGPFDVVAFNPPYLPTADEDKVEGVLNLAFDGGPDGNRVVLRFVEQLRHGMQADTILIIHSSLSDPLPLDSAMADLGYAMDIAASQKHFMEVLTVRRFVKKL